MTLQTQHPTPEHSPAVLTDEQRGRVADALENAQPRTPAGTMPASTASSVHGVNVKIRQRCRLSPR